MKTLTEKPKIPDEIVEEEILPRLPVASLLRFRSVSKPWYASISHPQFSLKTDTERVAVFFHGSSNIYTVDKECSVEMLPNPFGTGLSYSFYRVQLLCSYRGLLLICQYEDVFLFNPSTRELKKVLTYPLKEDTIYISGGICYDPATNDYKLVIATEDEDPDHDSLTVVVCSLSTQNWKLVEFNYAITLEDHGVVFDEKIHWLVYNKNDCFEERLIVCYDPVSDKSIEMHVPQRRQGGGDLSILDGCLALSMVETVTNQNSSVGVRKWEVWVMKQYGNAQSWTLLFNFPISFGMEDLPDYGRSYLRPLFFTKDGEVVFLCLRRIIAYNSREKTHRVIFEHPRMWNVETSVTYVPSLMSLP